jgi:DNA-binding response OmpR family regulator
MASNESDVRLQGKKIVIVEDDTFLGSLVVKKLMNAQGKVTLINKGGEAVAGVEKELPDIVLLDLLLPDMSGFDILKGIRENAKTSKTPVIVFSNLGEEKDIKQATDLGATAFLIKATISPDEIVAQIIQTLTGQK